jgi:2-polyprenyl-3-methyl-5-hydroxy-6-metoxy-1,4-benzoquinol methylase
MENTGERHIIGEKFVDLADYYIHLLHIASYEFALGFVTNKKILDFGCGSGYGAYMLAEKAESVLAVDISNDAISYAKDKFKLNNLFYTEIKNADFQKYDVITSFQVIEHVSNDKEYIRTLKNMLNPGGILLLTTPDRTNRLFRFQKPWNIYHLKEYSAGSMTKLLDKYFQDFEVLGITAPLELVIPEITRRKKQKIVTLPATLFFYPHFLRVFLLNFQAKAYKRISLKLRGKNHKESKNIQKGDALFLKYSSKDIKIIDDISEYTTDLFLICKNIQE